MWDIYQIGALGRRYKTWNIAISIDLINISHTPCDLYHCKMVSSKQKEKRTQSHETKNSSDFNQINFKGHFQYCAH